MFGLNFEAFEVTPLQHAPFDFLIVPGFIPPVALEAINRDFPPLQQPGNVPLAELTYGPAFGHLIDALQGPLFAERVAAKFGVDLSGKPMMITVRGWCDASDGAIHTDIETKVITALIYVNRAWPHEGGRLRLLRSATDLEDYVAEATPAGGTLLAFRRSDRSFHGHKPFVGARRLLQVNWVEPNRVSNDAGKDARLAVRLRRWWKRTPGG